MQSNDGYVQIAFEAVGKFNVGMAPDVYLKTMLPYEDTTDESYRSMTPSPNRIEALRKMSEATTETEQYDCFVSETNYHNIWNLR